MSQPFVPDGVKVLTVGELTREVKSLLENAYPRGVWVTGEVSNLSRPASGHVYFKLKDAESVLSTVMYRGVAYRLKYDLKDGMEVIARGRLCVYTPRGEYQLQVEELQPKGIGALELAFRQLREKLFTRGYFDPARKKPLPRFPRRVALVTSGTGAAVQDMGRTLARRWPLAEVWVRPVRVQGEGAAEEIAEAIRLLNRVAGGPEVLIVGRGGGSLEDLWAFNEEVVARAIFESRIPVISGVGHETDHTIADFVADCRALTPTDAACKAVPERGEVLEGLRATEARCRVLLKRHLGQAQTRLAGLQKRRVFQHPLDGVHERARAVDERADRLLRAVRQRLARTTERLEAQAARLESLSPLNVLARGYSLTRREADGAVVRSPEQVRPGDRLVSHVQHGRIISRVEQTQAATEPAAS